MIHFLQAICIPRIYLLIKTKSIRKHVRHVFNLADIPAWIDCAIECKCIIEHILGVCYTRHVPVIKILIKYTRISEHVCSAC